MFYVLLIILMFKIFNFNILAILYFHFTTYMVLLSFTLSNFNLMVNHDFVKFLYLGKVESTKKDTKSFFSSSCIFKVEFLALRTKKHIENFFSSSCVLKVELNAYL